MRKKIASVLFVLILSGAVGFFVYKTEVASRSYKADIASGKLSSETKPTGLAKFPFRLGLDLSGGSHLVYKADVSALESNQISDSMDALRDVIERRVNIFGVSEPLVQVQHGGLVLGSTEQLIIDLPGVENVEEAKQMIGQTPLLEFKTERGLNDPITVKPGKDGKVDLGVINADQQFVSTELTGRYLDHATLEFDPNTREPKVLLSFNSDGTKLFAEITKKNIDKRVAIYLDGLAISVPVVRTEITDGQAVISGAFNPQEARTLVNRLNSGALPVPIKLESTQTIGATLGDKALNAGVKAAVYGFLLVALFLILWYRLPGLVATFSLSIFVSIILALFKLIPVTLTAPGIAGFIISIGIAVDANVLIFERIKEEMKAGKNIADAISAGFSRAWLAIRDSNISNFITALILFWFGTSLIKGFALTLGMGVVVSLFTAITVTRIFLSVFSFVGNGKVARFLFSSGLSK